MLFNIASSIFPRVIFLKQTNKWSHRCNWVSKDIQRFFDYYYLGFAVKSEIMKRKVFSRFSFSPFTKLMGNWRTNDFWSIGISLFTGSGGKSEEKENGCFPHKLLILNKMHVLINKMKREKPSIFHNIMKYCKVRVIKKLNCWCSCLKVDIEAFLYYVLLRKKGKIEREKWICWL